MRNGALIIAGNINGFVIDFLFRHHVKHVYATETVGNADENSLSACQRNIRKTTNLPSTACTPFVRTVIRLG